MWYAGMREYDRNPAPRGAESIGGRDNSFRARGGHRVKYDLDTLRGDIMGGLTTMVVALPISLAYGVASGMGAPAGLYGAIAVGFFAALCGGTPTQVSGPTAPMAIAMAVIITGHVSSITEALMVIVLAGLLQMLLGVLRLGRFVAYTPYVVVSGFMSGIGVIVMAIQVLPFLGQDPVSAGAVGVVLALPGAVAGANVDAAIVGSITLVVAVFWPRRAARYLPASFAALVAGTLAGVGWFGDAPVIGPIPRGLPGFGLELPGPGFLLRAVEPAIILALIGSVVSLLTSLVANSMTGARHDPDRELIGQGVGNTVAGMFGGLPGAGTPVYTVPNIRAGGRTRAVGAIHALLLLGLLLGMGRYAEPIPLAALAGVLIKVGWDIVDWRVLGRLHCLRREHLFVLLTTLCLTVFVDLLAGVAMGLIAAGMAHAGQLERLELDSVVSVPLLDQMFLGEDAAPDPFSARVGMVALRGAFTVASSQKLIGTVGMDIKDHEVVIFDFSQATYIDDSAAMVIRQLIDVAAQENTETIVMGLSGRVARTLDALDVLGEVPDRRVVTHLDEARVVARTLLND